MKWAEDGEKDVTEDTRPRGLIWAAQVTPAMTTKTQKITPSAVAPRTTHSIVTVISQR